ncbi:MAG: hypothetical protein GXY03_05335 [Solirubrobacterales bacterium]|nr:hypothetical protein [Solirubrobacterales bacterium]
MRSTPVAVAAAALALLAVPAVAAAKPSAADRATAAKECRAERGSTPATREAFRERYGTNRNKRNAFGRCVSRGARAEAREDGRSRSNAARQCRAEAEELGREEFAAKYGTGKRGRNAFGKCVAATAKALRAEDDAEQREEIAERKSAAKQCAAERREVGPEAFAEKHGTNRNKRNAFGKCVSETAKQMDDDPEEGEQEQD